MKKKILVIAASIVMLGCLLLGCSDEPEPTAKPTQPTEPTTQTLPEITESVPQEPETEIASESKIDEPTEPPSEAHSEQLTEGLTTPATQEPVEEDILAQIDALINSVYALRDHYTAQLAAIEQDAIDQYYALPEEERTTNAKMRLALAAADTAHALEKECDSQIDTICAELGYLLTSANMPTSLVTEVRYTYAAEKETVKNSLIERYGAFFGG